MTKESDKLYSSQADVPFDRDGIYQVIFMEKPIELKENEDYSITFEIKGNEVWLFSGTRLI